MATTKKETITEETNVENEAAYEPGPWDPVDIYLPKTKDLSDDVTVWVNNRSWTIQRGKHVKIPYCAALVLDSSSRMEEQAIAFEEFAQGASARHAGEILAGRRNN